MDRNSNQYNSTISNDMRSAMCKSLDQHETDLAKSYSNMSFVNREPILPHEKVMASIRGQKLTDYRKVQEIRDTFDEDHVVMLELRDYKDWIKTKVMGQDIELHQEFERIN